MQFHVIARGEIEREYVIEADYEAAANDIAEEKLARDLRDEGFDFVDIDAIPEGV